MASNIQRYKDSRESRLLKPFIGLASGKTIDGRDIPVKWITDIIETYDTVIYEACIWWEHFHWIDSFGTVVSVEAADDLAGRKRAKITLNAFPRLIEANKAGKGLWMSGEIVPDFVGSGKAYLAGIGVTNEPAALTMERLDFSMKQAQGDLLISEPLRIETFDWQEPGSLIKPESRFLETLTKFFEGFTPKRKEEPPMMTSTPESAPGSIPPQTAPSPEPDLRQGVAELTKQMQALSAKLAANEPESAPGPDPAWIKKFSSLETSVIAMLAAHKILMETVTTFSDRLLALEKLAKQATGEDLPPHPPSKPPQSPLVW